MNGRWYSRFHQALGQTKGILGLAAFIGFLCLTFFMLNKEALWLLTAVLGFLLWWQLNSMKAYRRTKRELETLKANLPGGMIIYRADEHARFEVINEGLLELFGYSEQAFREVTNNSFYNMVLEADRKDVIHKLSQLVEPGDKIPLEYRIRNSAGGIRWLYDSAQLIVDEKGKKWIYMVVIDHTCQHEAARERQMNEARYKMIVEKSDNIIFEWYFEEDRVVLSDLWQKKLGYTLPDTQFFKNLFEQHGIHTEDVEKMAALLRAVRQGAPYKEAIVRYHRRTDDTYLWMKTCFMCVYDTEGRPNWAMGISIDMDGQIRQAQNFRIMAERDHLTGLFNRRAAEAKIKAYLNQGGKLSHGFIVLDVDNFKEINDGQGHVAGDHMLEGIAQVLRQTFRCDDVLGRLGGDEFVLFMVNVPSKKALNQKLSDVCQFIYQQNQHEISVSMGVAMYPQDGEDYEILYKKADEALYAAKGRGKNTFCFYQEIEVGFLNLP